MTEIEAIKRLGAAMIGYAVNDLQNKPIKSAEYKDALRWVANNDTGYELSFLRVCEFLELDSDHIRKGIYNHPSIKKKLAKSGLGHLINDC